MKVPAPKRTLTCTLALVVAATGLLSGCDERQQTRAAAIIDGQPLPASDVQQATREFNSGSSQGGRLQPANAVSVLTFGHFVLPALQEEGKGISDDAARKYLDKIDEPSRSTIDLVRSAIALNSLDQATQTKVADELRSAHITINPRYGSFDPKQLAISAESRNWMVGGNQPSATPAAP